MSFTHSWPAAQPARERRGALARLLDSLHPLYFLVDAARDPAILPLVQGGGCRHDSLFADERAIALAQFSPYLVVNHPGSSLRGDLIDHWGEAWGLYLTCDAPYESLLAHLRDWLWADTEDGPMLFRFYDPRVLSGFLPACNAGRAADFFGPVKAFIVEAADPDSFIYCTRGQGGVDIRSYLLAAIPPG